MAVVAGGNLRVGSVAELGDLILHRGAGGVVGAVVVAAVLELRVSNGPVLARPLVGYSRQQIGVGGALAVPVDATAGLSTGLDASNACLNNAVSRGESAYNARSAD